MWGPDTCYTAHALLLQSHCFTHVPFGKFSLLPFGRVTAEVGAIRGHHQYLCSDLLPYHQGLWAAPGRLCGKAVGQLRSKGLFPASWTVSKSSWKLCLQTACCGEGKADRAGRSRYRALGRDPHKLVIAVVDNHRDDGDGYSRPSSRCVH